MERGSDLMKNHLKIILSVAVVAMSLSLAACEEEAAEAETPAADNPPETAETTEAVAEEPAEEPEAEAADEGAGGGSACERAQSCCEAYVAEMTGGDTPTPGISVEQTCGNIEQLAASPAGASSCEQMISGWRTGLETAQRTVPSACAAD